MTHTSDASKIYRPTSDASRDSNSASSCGPLWQDNSSAVVPTNGRPRETAPETGNLAQVVLPAR